MFNLWSGRQGQGSFRQVLLIGCFVAVLCGCDPVKGVLASSSVEKTFSIWIWQEDEFVSVASLQGWQRFQENPLLVSKEAQKPVLTALNTQGTVFWWTGGELYTFPFRNPAQTRVLDDPLFRYLLIEKNLKDIFSYKDRVYFLFHPKMQKQTAFWGVSLVSVNLDGSSEAVVMPFQLAHPLAHLVSLDLHTEGWVIHWREDDIDSYTFWTPEFPEEHLITWEQVQKMRAFIPAYQLDSSLHRLLKKVKTQQDLSSFYVTVSCLPLGFQYTIQFGDNKSESLWLTAVENEHYWALLVEKTLYFLKKETGFVSSISLPSLGGDLIYTKAILTEEGCLVVFRLASLGADIAGFLQFPYAK